MMNKKIKITILLIAVTFAVALTSCTKTEDAKTELDNPFFAMDTGTKDANHLTAESQAKMLAELGYD